MNEIPTLSSQGRLRSRDILRAAQRSASRRRTGRHVRQGAVVVGAIIVAGAMVLRTFLAPGQPPVASMPSPGLLVVPQSDNSTPMPPAASPPLRLVLARALPHSSPVVVITHIQSDPALPARVRLVAASPSYQRIGDDELLHCLSVGGTPAALTYVAGKQALVLPKDTLRSPPHTLPKSNAKT